MKKYQVQIELPAPTRVDKALATLLPEFTRSQIQYFCNEGFVERKGQTLSKNDKVEFGDVITLWIPEETEVLLQPEPLSIERLYEDDFLLIVNKPKGLLVHPTYHERSGTLVNRLLYHYPHTLSTLAGEERPGIVHRLDKDTSGLLLVAKDNQTHELLNKQMQEGEIVRKYQGIVYGHLSPDRGQVHAPIGRDPRNRTRMAVVEEGREAITNYHTLEEVPHFSHVEFSLVTGRTHQIRVHMAEKGNPLAGDVIYGPKKVITQLEGQCLHSYYLEFTHPITGELIRVESSLPAYFTTFLHQIKNL